MASPAASSPIEIGSKLPIQCQIRCTINKIRDSQHTLNRSMAALQTWAMEGDMASINKECSVVKCSIAITMEFQWQPTKRPQMAYLAPNSIPIQKINRPDGRL